VGPGEGARLYIPLAFDLFYRAAIGKAAVAISEAPRIASVCGSQGSAAGGGGGACVVS
jgi:hypothetical protein